MHNSIKLSCINHFNLCYNGIRNKKITIFNRSRSKLSLAKTLEIQVQRLFHHFAYLHYSSVLYHLLSQGSSWQSFEIQLVNQYNSSVFLGVPVLRVSPRGPKFSPCHPSRSRTPISSQSLQKYMNLYLENILQLKICISTTLPIAWSCRWDFWSCRWETIHLSERCCG